MEWKEEVAGEKKDIFMIVEIVIIDAILFRYILMFSFSSSYFFCVCVEL